LSPVPQGERQSKSAAPCPTFLLLSFSGLLALRFLRCGRPGGRLFKGCGRRNEQEGEESGRRKLIVSFFFFLFFLFFCSLVKHHSIDGETAKLGVAHVSHVFNYVLYALQVSSERLSLEQGEWGKELRKFYHC
jgi:hypothetical protein